MGQIADTLSAAAGDAFEAIGLDRSFGAFAPCADQSRGDFQCMGAMPAAKAARMAPRDVGQRVALALGTHPVVLAAEVAGPGFVNVRVAPAALAASLGGPAVPPSPAAGSAVVDSGGPNIATIQNASVGEVYVRVADGRVPPVGLAPTEAVPSPMGDGTASRRR